MSSNMTPFAKGNAVAHFVPQLRGLYPCNEVMDMKPASPFAASLTSPVISLKCALPECLIGGKFPVGISWSCGAATPVGVVCAARVGKVASGAPAAACQLTRTSNRSLVGRSERASGQDFGQGSSRFGSCFWRHQACQLLRACRCRANLRSRSWPLGRIILAVGPLASAGWRAEANTIPTIIGSAFFADSILQLRHRMASI